jgi:hypothetical protein
MPTVRYPAVLKAVYLEAARLINGRSIPTEILSAPRALEASTVRGSARSSEETGDNIVFFGKDGQNIPNLYIEKAYLFPIAGPAMEVPVEF